MMMHPYRKRKFFKDLENFIYKLNDDANQNELHCSLDSTPPLSIKENEQDLNTNCWHQHLHEQSPLQQEQSPLLQEQFPLQQEQSPLQQEQSPLQQEQFPLQQEQSLLQQEQSLLQQEQSLLQQEQFPLQQEQSPLQQQLPLQQEQPLLQQQLPLQEHHNHKLQEPKLQNHHNHTLQSHQIHHLQNNVLNPHSATSQNSSTEEKSYESIHIQDESTVDNETLVEFDSISVFQLPCEENEKKMALCKLETVTLLREKQSPIFKFHDYLESEWIMGIHPCWRLQRHQCPYRYCYQADSLPILFFCLQALDEYIAMNSVFSRNSFNIQACKLALIVLGKMWKEGMTNDLLLCDILDRSKRLPGISPVCWVIVSIFWKRYKGSIHHHSTQDISSPIQDLSLYKDIGCNESDMWHEMKDLMVIFGVSSSRVVDLYKDNIRHRSDLIHFSKCTVYEKLGLDYLNLLNHVHQSNVHSFPLLLTHTQLQVGVDALRIHLQNVDPLYQVFSCGTLARGALFGHVLDVLVTHPTMDSTSQSKINCILKSSGILQQKIVHVNDHRSLTTIKLKEVWVVLDLKIGKESESSISLLYYIGPTSTLSLLMNKIEKALNMECTKEMEYPQFYSMMIQALDYFSIERNCKSEIDQLQEKLRHHS